MRQYLIIVSLFFLALKINAQTPSLSFQFYVEQWREIDSLTAIGKKIASYEKIKELHERAKHEHNTAQIVKTLLFKTVRTVSESKTNVEDYAVALRALQNATNEAVFSEKPLLQSMLGEIYMTYLSNNYYHKPKKDTIFPTGDIRSLTRDEIFILSKKMLAASVSDLRTQRLQVNILDPLTKSNSKNEDKLRPTVFDFLAYRALDMLNNIPYELNKTEAISYDTLPLFASINTFLSFQPKIQDTLHVSFLQLDILKKLLSFHQYDAEKYALIDAEMTRYKVLMKGGRNYAEKLKMYRYALENAYKIYENDPSVIPIADALSEHYESLAAKFEGFYSQDTTYRFYKKYAYDICENTLQKYPNTEGVGNLSARIARLKIKSLDINIEQVNLPDAPILVQVTYKNTDTIYGQWLRMPAYADTLSFKNDSARWAFYKQLPTVKTFAQTLPQAEDFQKHIVEVILEPMPFGHYVLLITSDSHFNKNMADSTLYTEGVHFKYLKTQVSQLAAFYFIEKRGFAVVDRSSGDPLKGISVIKNGFKGTTYKDGFTHNLSTDDLFFVSKNDTLVWMNHDSEDYSNNKKEDVDETETTVKITFFTDRNIYRPSQTIHFQGIMVKMKMKDRIQEHAEIWKNQRVKVGLFKGHSVSDLEDFDEALQSIILTTNEFGSFTATFTAPSGGELGDFQIIALPYSDSEKELEKWENELEINDFSLSTEIKVEEYKRPRFELVWEPVSRSYKPDEWVTVRGYAKAYAGSVVDGAKVKYSVNRRIERTYSDYPNSYNGYNGIMDSTIETTADGSFNIRFKAKTAWDSDEKDNKTYIFTIKATVTDLNGETHESSTTVKVGAASLEIYLISPKRIDPRKSKTIPLSIRSLEGKPVNAKGTIRLELLENTPFYINRYWSRTADTFIYDEAFFNKNFPQLAYFNKNDEKREPQILKTIFEERAVFDSTLSKTGLILKNSDTWAAGKYRLWVKVYDEVLRDTISQSIIFDVFDFDKNKAPDADKITVFMDKNAYSIGETVDIRIHTPFEKGHFLLEIVHNDNIIKCEWLDMARLKTYHYTIRNSDRGTLSYRLTAVRNNRIYCETGRIPIANDDKNLPLELASFRDHLAPAQEETWEIKITDALGKNLSAELVATLYDASLDNLQDNEPHSWNPLNIFNFRNNVIQPVLNGNFDDIAAFEPHIFNYQQSQMKESESTKIYKPNLREPRNWLWYSAYYYYFDDDDVSLLRYLSHHKDGSENPQDILGGIFYENGQRYIAVITKVQADSNGILKPFMVIGYGIMTKKNMTGAVSVIKSRDLSNISQADLINTLQGRVAGVQIQGVPSDANTIFIRGSRSNFTELYEDTDSDKYLTSLQEVVVTGYGTVKKTALPAKPIDLSAIKVRKKLNETVFFMPQMHTDGNGKVSLKFTMNEALSRWKFMAFAHTADLKSGVLQNMVVTQKDLMVFPNMPRFLREGDKIELSAKVSNFKSAEILRGAAALSLFNAATMQPLDSLFFTTDKTIKWVADSGQSAILKWTIHVPEGKEIPAIIWRVVAQSGDLSDGEENVLPILPKQILLTQTTSVSIEGGKKQIINFPQLEKADSSSTLRHHQWSLNVVANPAWNAVTGLAYSMEYPQECSEQLFSRFYANALAASVFENMPQLKAYLSKLANKNDLLQDKSALPTNELTSTLMEEVPELLSRNGAFDRKKLTILFDLNRMAAEQKKAFEKLATRRTASGGLSWYPEGEPSWFISQHIAAGLGHLETLDVKLQADEKIKQMVNEVVHFMDKQIVDYYENKRTIDKNYVYWRSNDQNLAIQYLYARSFYPYIPQSDTVKRALDSTLVYVEKNWKNLNLYSQALSAIALHRLGKVEIAKEIIKTLKSKGKTDESGMHWASRQGIYWYEMPTETQSLMIEAFNEITQDSTSIQLMKQHLLSLMEENGRWNSTKATSEAVYALLRIGNNDVNKTENIKISSTNFALNQALNHPKMDDTGFVYAAVDGSKVDKNLANTTIINQNSLPISGNISWQFYENVDKIKAYKNNDTTIQLFKRIYKIAFKGGEEILIPIDSTPLSIGDKLRIKLTLKIAKPIEYLHLKDMRPAGCEPMEVLSKREWNGASYYKTTRDISTNFFFDNLYARDYELEYDVTVQQAGDFANGVASAQCMYAPQMTVYTEGGRTIVKSGK